MFFAVNNVEVRTNIDFDADTDVYDRCCVSVIVLIRDVIFVFDANEVNGVEMVDDNDVMTRFD
jgi:hypothetical protein